MSKMLFRRLIVLLVPLACIGLAASGCTGGAGSSECEGTVTFKGKPLPAGSVVFEPEQGGTGGAASGISSDGKYHCVGLKPGKMKVYITPPPKGSAPMGPGGPGKADPRSRDKEKMNAPAAPDDSVKNDPRYKALTPTEGPDAPEIPAKFKSADSSGLTVEIKSGKNTFNIDLGN
jgi:hypothetical protein